MSTENNLFITAARKKYRFASHKGYLSVEDLFDSTLDSLDIIAQSLDQIIQKAGAKSFVKKRTPSSVEESEKLEIVKFVIETKIAEADERKTRADKASQKAFLGELLNKKKLEKLEGLTAEEIEAQIKALE